MDLNDLDLLTLKNKAAVVRPSKFKPRTKLQKKSAKHTAQDGLSSQGNALITQAGIVSDSGHGQPVSGTVSAVHAVPAAVDSAARAARSPTGPQEQANDLTPAGTDDAAPTNQHSASAPTAKLRKDLAHVQETARPTPTARKATATANAATPAEAPSAHSGEGDEPNPAAYRQQQNGKSAIDNLATPGSGATAACKPKSTTQSNRVANGRPLEGRVGATKGSSTLDNTASTKATPGKSMPTDSQASDDSCLTATPHPATPTKKQPAGTRAQRAAKRAAVSDKESQEAGSPSEGSTPVKSSTSKTTAKKRKAPAGDQPIDVDTMSLKEVIQWSNSRERIAMNAEKAELKRRAASMAEERSRQGAAGSAVPAPAPVPALPAPPPFSNTGGGIAPQVHIVNGQIVVNTDTLTLQAQGPAAPRTVVSGLSQTLNSSSYAINRSAPERWLPEQTENFYNALATFGSDFQTISTLFPGKDRRVIKNKFRRESKLCPRRIDDALKGRSCNTSAYREVLLRMQHDANSEDMLEIAKED